MTKPCSPYEAVPARIVDSNDWISFPPFHAHVARVVMPGGDHMYAPRVRDSDGCLRFLSEPSRILELARREIDDHWKQVCNSPQFDRDDFEWIFISRRWKTLDRLKAAACELAPPDAQSPYKPVTLDELRLIDPHEYPRGYPIIVKDFDRSEEFPDIVVYRNWENKFRDYHERLHLFTHADVIIKELLYRSTVPANFIEYCDESTQDDFRNAMLYR